MRLCTPCNMSWPVIDVSVVVYAIWVVYQYTNSIIWWQDKLAWHCAVPMKMGCKYIQQTTIITTSNAPTQSWCSMCCILPHRGLLQLPVGKTMPAQGHPVASEKQTHQLLANADSQRLAYSTWFALVLRLCAHNRLFILSCMIDELVCLLTVKI